MINDPGNLISSSSYKGKDKTYIDNGTGLSISHTGKTILS